MILQIPYANSWNLWLKIYPHVHLRHSADEGDDITCLSYSLSFSYFGVELLTCGFVEIISLSGFDCR